jgi:hypothetical protein
MTIAKTSLPSVGHHPVASMHGHYHPRSSSESLNKFSQERFKFPEPLLDALNDNVVSINAYRK